MKLENKVALVTGASRGIGRAIAEVFAEQGAHVAINYLNPSQQHEITAELVRSQGRKALTIKADVTKRSEVETLFKMVWEELGPIDILVNNAGIESVVPFLDLTDEQWSWVTEGNQKSVWLCSQVFCKRVLEEGRPGNIVNIGSIQAGKALPGRTHYGPSKLAIEGLTRNISAEMTSRGIRVNCIHPGLIDTEMTSWVMGRPDLLNPVLAQISMGRAGHPREIANVAAFLASEESSYLTGQSIFVDGGWEGK